MKRTSTAIGFWFLIFYLEYLIRVQISSEPFHAKINPTSCLFGSRFAYAQIFSPDLCFKNAGETSIVLRIAAREKRIPHPAIQTKIEQHFGRFFHQIKVWQPIGRQDSVQTVIWTSRRLDSFLQWLRTSRSNPAGQYLVDILSQVEDELESALVSMFERTDPMKAWELKKMSNAAWQDAFRS